MRNHDFSQSSIDIRLYRRNRVECNGPSPTTPAAIAESPLAGVAWLVGGTWVSDVKEAQDGSVTHIENHVSWAPNHQAI
jgi:ethanolamine utilization microcompartment shell protein EutL